jgi:hypothetical protein
MAELRLVNGAFPRKQKNNSIVVHSVEFFGEDADLFERFCAENEFELASQAVRALVIGGISDWPKWGVEKTIRRRLEFAFKHEMNVRFADRLYGMLKELKAEIQDMEMANAHQT